MQSKNKNDSIQLPTRYQCYDFAKRHLRGTSRPEVFPFGGTTVNNTRKIKVVGNLDSPTWQKRNESIRRVHDINGLSPTIPTGTGGGVMNKVIANTVDANYYKGINVNPGHASSNRGYKIDGKIRRLTPKECERLQGFPDDWTDEVSDTQRYKQCGNAVTVNVVREIIKKLV